MKKCLKKYWRKLKEHIEEIKKTKKSPLSIATGFALATFLAILPTLGLAIAIGILLIAIFKRLNKYAMFAGFAVWNPFVLAPIFGVSQTVGKFFIPNVQTKLVQFQVSAEIYRYTVQFLLGNLILAVFIAVVSFFGVWITAKIYQKIAHRNDSEHKDFTKKEIDDFIEEDFSDESN